MRPSLPLNRVLSLVIPVTIGLLLPVLASASKGTGDYRSRPLHKRVTSPKMAAGVSSFAPTYHNGVTLRCSDCHAMHESRQHPVDGDPLSDPFGPYPQNYNGGKSLLKAPDPVDLCLTCHDNQTGIPDVMTADANGLTERSAGFFAPVGTRNPRGHSLDRGQSLEGSDLCNRCHFNGMADASVSCIDCHNPHGNNKSRNLQWASWPGGEPEFGMFEAASATGLQRYEAANIGFGTDAATVFEVTNMCIDCHHVYSGDWNIDPDGDGIHNRHPSSEAEWGSTNNIAQGAAEGTTVPAHWVAGTGVGFQETPRLRFVNNPALNFVDATEIDPAKNGVFCLSCHRAHGGENSFSLRWNPVGTFSGEGCDQCHAKN
ncbi:MAG: hypothetical protein HZB43_05480 [candidate division Zixibacteria bacterium]|nr:hypothetical protein [candidate division Zixibacteria bacterium]